MQSGICTSARRRTARLLLSLLAFSTAVAGIGLEANARLPPPAAEYQQSLPYSASPSPLSGPQSGSHEFSLRHVFHHGTYQNPSLHVQFDVVSSDSSIWLENEDEHGRPVRKVPTKLKARTQPMHIERLKDRRPVTVEPLVAAARLGQSQWSWMSTSAWTVDELAGPNITDKETIITLAQMPANAYVPEPETGEWKDVNGGFNRTDDYGFGWDSDGLRGYIYADETNSTIVIGLKGTSLAVYDGEGTTTHDKENDNLYFSCCCGQQGSALYRKVCECATDTYTCNTSCLKKKLKEDNRYYMAARHLYSNVSELYPDANIWMSGHSLGGSLSAMIGLTYGVPVVTFEAVPDALPAGRLGLPSPPNSNPDAPQVRQFTGAYHFGNTADPIYLGICNGATASCSYAGYALESACHTGMECVYDVVGDWGWGVHIWSHRIVAVIENIIKKYDSVPECKYTPECVDCPLWKEVTGNSSLTTSTLTTSTTSRKPTRTSTCKTPGWWGCLDKTTGGDSTTTTPTSTTSSCKTPGWFGCKDKTSTTETTSNRIKTPPITHPSSHTTTTSTTSRCRSRGYFGCLDPTSTTSMTSTTTPPITSCHTPGYFWGCKDEPSTATTKTKTKTKTHPETSSPSPLPSTPTRTSPGDKKTRCIQQSWFGWCLRWEL